MLSPSELLKLDNIKIHEELGKAVKSEHLGALPEEEDADFDDHIIGANFFERHLRNIKQIYCTNSLAERLKDEEKNDVDLFVAALLDSFLGYYGMWAGTIILVIIYRFGIDKFCLESNQ